jgi:hypothetical protein
MEKTESRTKNGLKDYCEEEKKGERNEMKCKRFSFSNE